MPAVCRADVEALLRTRKLDRTLVPLESAAAGTSLTTLTVPTGMPDLDRQLGGGFPLGQFSEIAGPRSSGRTSLLMAVLAAATSRGELTAVVDTFDVFDPESAAAAGVALDQMLWVRGEACAAAIPLMASRQIGAERIIARALKAFNLILQSGGFGVVVLDLAEAPAQALRRVPMTTWLRLQRVLEGQEAIGLMLGQTPLSRSAGGVTVSLKPGAGIAGRAFEGRVFRGLESDVLTARARLVPGLTDSRVRLQISA